MAYASQDGDAAPARNAAADRRRGQPRHRLIAGLLLGLLGLVALAANAAPPVSVPVRAVQVAAHTWLVQGMAGEISRANEGFNSNAAFVVTDDGVVVFDALGSPPLGAALVAAIRAVTPQPIRRAIVSHFHADHFYGLQALQEAGAEVWAHAAARDYLASDAPRLRLAERRQSLAPWVDQDTRIVAPDLWLDGDVAFTMGNLHFQVMHVGPAHTAEDLALVVVEDDAILVGDLLFAGRIPFVGAADSKAWLGAIDALGRSHPKVMIGGHGAASFDAGANLELTRDYLLYLRRTMGEAADAMLSFDQAYARTDWSRFAHLPAFDGANRRNAYNTYLLMEREGLER